MKKLISINEECTSKKKDNLCEHYVKIRYYVNNKEAASKSGIFDCRDIGEIILNNRDLEGIYIIEYVEPKDDIKPDKNAILIYKEEKNYYECSSKKYFQNHYLQFLDFKIVDNTPTDINKSKYRVKFDNKDKNKSNYQKEIMMSGKEIYELLIYTKADMSLEHNKYFLKYDSENDNYDINN